MLFYDDHGMWLYFRELVYKSRMYDHCCDIMAEEQNADGRKEDLLIKELNYIQDEMIDSLREEWEQWS